MLDRKMNIQAFWIVAYFSTAVGLPHWKKCPASDPNVEECLKGAVQDAVISLAKGSEMGLIDLEPVHHHSKIALIDTTSGPFRGKLIYNEITIEGFSKAEVKKVEKKGGGRIRIELFFPKTSIHGKYLMDTVLLAVPMKGNGDFVLNSDNLTITFDFKISTKNIKGVKVYNADSVSQPSYNVDYLQIHHTNLFNGNKALGDNINRILNEQWRVLAKELGPITVNAFAPVYSTVTNKVLNKIPAADYPLPLS